MRMQSAPRIDAHLIESSEPPTGVGEVSVPTAAPALTNAIAAITGTRSRRLPSPGPCGSSDTGRSLCPIQPSPWSSSVVGQPVRSWRPEPSSVAARLLIYQGDRSHVRCRTFADETLESAAGPRPGAGWVNGRGDGDAALDCLFNRRLGAAYCGPADRVSTGRRDGALKRGCRRSRRILSARRIRTIRRASEADSWQLTGRRRGVHHLSHGRPGARKVETSPPSSSALVRMPRWPPS